MNALALDDLDRHIVACLQADGRASWTAIADRCGTSVATASRRGQKILARGAATVVVTRTNIHQGASSMFFLRIRCRNGYQSDVLTRLAGEPSIRFLAMVSGRFDIIAELCADPDDSLYRQLVAGTERLTGIERCEADLVLHVHKVSQDWGWQLLHGEAAASPVHEQHLCDAGHLDEWDDRIIECLRRDGRLAFSAVATEVGLDETTVRRRFETKSARGCVRTLTLVPAAALGFTSELLVDVEVDPARLHDVATRLVGFPGVRFVADMLNTASLLCELIMPNAAQLHEFLTGTLAKLDGVRGWNATMEVLTVRRGYVETPWWRQQLRSATVEAMAAPGAFGVLTGNGSLAPR